LKKRVVMQTQFIYNEGRRQKMSGWGAGQLKKDRKIAEKKTEKYH